MKDFTLKCSKNNIDDVFNKFDNWTKLKCYLEGAINCEENRKPYEQIYSYMLELENESNIDLKG